VLRLITRLNVGGPARHALLLARLLRPEYETVLAAGVPGPNEGELAHADVRVTRVPLVRPLRAVDDARALAAVRRLLLAQRPEILHTHMAKAGSVGRLMALTVRAGPLTVHTFHGHVLRDYFGRRTEQAMVAAEAWLARRTDLLIAVSTEVRDDLVAMGVGRREQYEVVPVGLDLAPFLAVEAPSGRLRAQVGLAPDVPLVGVVGRLVPIKDHAVLLSAMALLPSAHLAIIGDGDLRPSLEAQARQLGLADRVHFTGWWKDMAAALSDVDVVALTSRNEGTPVALIEASAARRAVVATAVGGVASVVEHGTTGFLVPPGDPEAVAQRLGALLADPAGQGRMGDAGRERVATAYGETRLLDDIRRIYAELLGRAGRGARR